MNCSSLSSHKMKSREILKLIEETMEYVWLEKQPENIRYFCTMNIAFIVLTAGEAELSC